MVLNFQSQTAYRFQLNANFKTSLNSATDVQVDKDQGYRMPRYDMFLRRFQYSKALDAVLVPYIRKKKPAITVGVMHELIR